MRPVRRFAALSLAASTLIPAGVSLAHAGATPPAATETSPSTGATTTTLSTSGPDEPTDPSTTSTDEPSTTDGSTSSTSVSSTPDNSGPASSSTTEPASSTAEPASSTTEPTTTDPAPVTPTTQLPNVAYNGPPVHTAEPSVPLVGIVLPGRTPTGAPRNADVETVLATIRTLESGGDYAAHATTSTASGAYQYLETTWQAYDGYQHASDAPREVQDERARRDVTAILTANGRDVSEVPLRWYYPASVSDRSLLSWTPPGNSISIGDYQARWLDTYRRLATALPAASPVPTGAPKIIRTSADPALAAELGSVVVDPVLAATAAEARPVTLTAGELAFPVLGPVTFADTWVAPPENGRQHEGTDLIGVKMQPVLAAFDGTVGRADLDRGGISGDAISITRADGWRANYFHLNNDTPGTDDNADAIRAWTTAPGIAVGSHVRAGQVIGYMGNSGDAAQSVTHLHFEIRDPAGVAHPSYALLADAATRQQCTIGIGPWSTPVLATDAADPSHGAELDVAHPAVQHASIFIDGGSWTIDTDGRVTAVGTAALIAPDKSCTAPVAQYGTDASGWSAALETDAVGGHLVTADVYADTTANLRLDDVIGITSDFDDDTATLRVEGPR